jgi:hypothetical protein
LSHAVKIRLFQTRQRGSKLPRGDILPVTAKAANRPTNNLLVVFDFFELGVDHVIVLFQPAQPAVQRRQLVACSAYIF